MAVSIACLTGAAVGATEREGLGTPMEVRRPKTPFGLSETLHLIDVDGVQVYAATLCDADGRHLHPGSINYRATMYALKDLGVQGVIGVSAVGSITHSFNVGDVVLMGDLIDRTTQRAGTFFPRLRVGVLRQFPAFCPFLSAVMGDYLAETNASLHANSTLIVTEGPRLETPAEIRFFSAAGGEVVGHYFAPEAFLAKELEMCFAGVGYVANYAETGSRHRPFCARDLFGGLTTCSESERIDQAVRTITETIRAVARDVAGQEPTCECAQTMRHASAKYNLPEDWRRWFAVDDGDAGSYEPVGPRRQQDRPSESATVNRTSRA